jgi:hypothetical protein
MKSDIQIIGRTQHVSFPRLGIRMIEAKIDTGAFTGALHCHHISLVTIKGTKVLQFYLLDPGHPEYSEKRIRFKKFEIRKIKNSFGETEERFVIKTTIQIGDRRIKAHFSLTDRGSMKYPVLIGRRLLKNRYWVDVSCRQLLAATL